MFDRTNRLTLVRERVEKRGQYWLALFDCSCGGQKTARICEVKSNHVMSCGCMKLESMRYNMSKSRGSRPKYKCIGRSKDSVEYKTWLNIKRRCYDKRVINYRDYGGRGIAVCDKWLDSFEAFYADMGVRPSRDHSIDRIDNDGDYEASNCRWASRVEQSRNRRSNVIAESCGLALTIVEWAEALEVPDSRIRARLKDGWSINDALFKPKTANGYTLLYQK